LTRKAAHRLKVSRTPFGGFESRPMCDSSAVCNEAPTRSAQPPANSQRHFRRFRFTTHSSPGIGIDSSA
jgi:hypothetical protein